MFRHAACPYRPSDEETASFTLLPNGVRERVTFFLCTFLPYYSRGARWRFAVNRGRSRTGQCLLSAEERKTSARTEYFAV
jgi:hypothetical protein